VAPLSELTHQDVPWRWEETEKRAFQELKDKLSNAPTVKYYDINLPTELVVDASPIGLGAILTQRTPEGHVNTVAYASRKLTPTEQKYSQTEREALGAVWGSEHFHLYLYGVEYLIVTDHKPLVGIFSKVNSTPTARLDRMCLRLLPYKWKVEYRPGKTNPADYLSRHPISRTESPNHQERSWVEEQVRSVIVCAIKPYAESGFAITLDEIRDATQNDPELQEVIKYIQNQRWFESSANLQSYKNVRNELSLADGLVMRGDRIVIPQKLQDRVIKTAHRSHQGIVKTKQFLRETVWFTNLDRLVEKAVSHCLYCQVATPKSCETMEPLKMTPLPDGPWSEVAVDFSGPFKNGDYLLVVIDEYSRFPEVEVVTSTSAEAVLPKLDSIFSRHGIPRIVKSDNGPPFNGETFERFARTQGFIHRKVTPLWPRANGEVERFMRVLGKCVRIAQMEYGNYKQELYRFLRHYRATPHSTTGKSPAELLNNRKLRTEVPTVRKQVKFTDDRLRERDARCKAYMKELADDRNHAKDSGIERGDTVLVRQEKRSKLDTPYRPSPYVVTNTKGSMITARNGEQHTITRNSSHFKRIPPTANVPDTQDETSVPNVPNVLDTSSTPELPDSNVLTPSTMDTDAEPRRSVRVRQPPVYLKDFVQKVY